MQVWQRIINGCTGLHRISDAGGGISIPSQLQPLSARRRLVNRYNLDALKNGGARTRKDAGHGLQIERLYRCIYHSFRYRLLAPCPTSLTYRVKSAPFCGGPGGTSVWTRCWRDLIVHQSNLPAKQARYLPLASLMSVTASPTTWAGSSSPARTRSKRSPPAPHTSFISGIMGMA